WIYFYLFHYFKVMRYAVSSKPDIVWATGDPWSSLVLGSLVARKLSVPFICDFRDPWTRSGVSLRERSSFSRYWDKKLEYNVLKHASKVVFTSRSAEKDYLENFKFLHGKTGVIYNAANEPIDPKTEDLNDSAIRFKSHDLNITFFGTFRRLSPIDPIAEMLTELRHQSPETFSKIKVHSFGEPDDEQLRCLRERRVDEQFVFHQKVKPEQGARVLQQSDVLLLSTHPERGNIVPAKLWDYLITDVPILSIVPNPEVEEIIKEFQAGEHVRPGELANAAGIISEWASKKTVEGAKSLRREPLSDAQKKKIGSRRKAEELAGIFDQITEHD
ncbi:MAG TPA: glycosyltransferase, partial [Balneolaceae bacterium]|nr:glycosyltransferase [Balneolaceae bacterium]